MTEQMQHAQILLTPEQYNAYSAIAQREGRSLSAVVRDVLQRDLDQRTSQEDEDVQRRLQALEEIRQFRQKILERRGGEPLNVDTVALIEEMRKERDEHLFTIATGHSR